jgi:hypothetical protein
MTSKKPSSAAASSSGTDLKDLKILTFHPEDFTSLPVIFAHVPPEGGLTTLIESLLLETQKHLRIDCAMILTDRYTETYMGGVFPSCAVYDLPFNVVLRTSIDVQIHRKSTRSFGRDLPVIAIAVDNSIYTAKILRSETCQRDIRLAKEHNIMIIIGTSDIDVLPTNSRTLASHVITTKSLSTDEPKLLQKRLFVMFDSPAALAEVMSHCNRYEFLVGLMRSSASGGSGSDLSNYVRAYKSSYYIKDESYISRPPWRTPGYTPSIEDAGAIVVPDGFIMNSEWLVPITHAFDRAGK